MGNVIGQFAGYTLREVCEDDREMLDKWIHLDPVHDGLMTADYYLGIRPDGTQNRAATCYALEDEKGVVFFIRLSKAARVKMQFHPSQKHKQLMRNADAMLQGMAFIESMLSHANTEEWIFDSSSDALTLFATTQLGFMVSPNELTRFIEPPKAAKKNPAA